MFCNYELSFGKEIVVPEETVMLYDDYSMGNLDTTNWLEMSSFRGFFPMASDIAGTFSGAIAYDENSHSHTIYGGYIDTSPSDAALIESTGKINIRLSRGDHKHLIPQQSSDSSSQFPPHYNFLGIKAKVLSHVQTNMVPY